MLENFVPENFKAFGMKKCNAKFLILLGAVWMTGSVAAQIGFDPEIDFELVPDEVIVPPSPIQKQVIFIGGHDTVQTTPTYGNPAGAFPAKQWHDFIGFTPDVTPGTQDLGWISVNHEMITADPNIGDGGGMTVFKIRRDAATDSIVIVEQTLTDGRSGKFFNVDFANTVGETGMNCGGIVSEADGRIWTAEEWLRTSNASIYTYENVAGIQDTTDFTINGSGIAMAEGETIRKFENFNWMVEVDPREAVAIRKQYNWGRQPFEGGVVMPDNRTVYTGADDTPGLLTKFVADTPGDFTNGTVYAYRADDQQMRLSHMASFENAFSEISAYDAVNQRIYSTRGNQPGVTVLSFANPTVIDSIDFIDLSAYNVPTSVDVYNGVLAVAVPNVITQNPGQVLFFDNNYNLLNAVTVGALPDMVTFTKDGNYVLVANEGEPNDDYTVDPDGSVSVINVSSGIASATVQTATFDAYTVASLPAGVRVFGNGTTDVSADFEPEYIAVNGASTKAYVTLQENNAIAVIDIATATVEDILSLGFKDFSNPDNAIDASDDDNQIGNFQTWDNVYGMYLPDAIALVEIGGTEYLITANEGDSRDYSGYSEEARVGNLVLDPTMFPNAATIQQDEELGRLKVTTSMGDIDNDGDFDALFSYGARSFSIWDLNGNQVFDSGNEFGQILAGRFSGNYPDDRDDDKGSEPESVVVAEVGGRMFAYIGLERAAGVMVYDITDPANAFYVHYYNKNGIDESPEGLEFISAADSPDGRAYLLSTNEAVSNNGSVSAYNVNGFDGEKWIRMDNTRLDKMLNFTEEAINAGATLFNRLEWLAYNPQDGNVYITETGRDNPGSAWKDDTYRGGLVAAHHETRATAQGTNPLSSSYVDFYGRVLRLDASTEDISVALEAGPEFNSQPNVPIGSYPDVHLANPDGLTFMTVGQKTYMVICEDLNGTSYGRMPAGISNRSCELYILDMSISNPALDDLVRIAQVPVGAEVTGVRATPDGKTLFFNSQHPDAINPFPYNNSVTIALTGWDKMDVTGLNEVQADEFMVYPNPTSRYVYFSEKMDVALYNSQGKLIRVERGTDMLDIMNIEPGAYVIKNSAGQAKKLIIQ